jgi:hypothetical protein
MIRNSSVTTCPHFIRTSPRFLFLSCHVYILSIQSDTLSETTSHSLQHLHLKIELYTQKNHIEQACGSFTMCFPCWIYSDVEFEDRPEEGARPVTRVEPVVSKRAKRVTFQQPAASDTGAQLTLQHPIVPAIIPIQAVSCKIFSFCNFPGKYTLAVCGTAR